MIIAKWILEKQNIEIQLKWLYQVIPHTVVSSKLK